MENKKPTRCYVRNVIKNATKEIKKAKRVLGFPAQINCKVCYKKGVPLDEAVFVEGGGTQGHYGFWMCNDHL